MDHLTYQETSNRPFDPYYNKFKKMVKEDLSGDGWFLLVKNFPFKDGEKLMFTAGETIGKWQDKNLVSLYGKKNYIIGRCRKRGPVLTLLDFQEGDYIKEATESGLRKELKEYFKGTGVSIRVFRSLKVDDEEPEPTQEELEDDEILTSETQEEREQETGTAETEDKELEMPEMKPTSIKKTLSDALEKAEKLGVSKAEEFVDLLNDFSKAVPRAPLMKISLKKLNMYFERVRMESVSEGTASGAFLPEIQARLDSLEQQKKELTDEYDQLQKQVGKNLEAILKLSESDSPTLEDLERQLELAEENEQRLLRMEEIKHEAATVNEQLKEIRSTAKV